MGLSFFMLILMMILMNLSFSFFRKHLLLVLLVLEFLVLLIFMTIMNYLILLGSNGGEMYFLMVFLVFSVCEGVLGISMMVYMVRSYGNDYFKSFNLVC